MKKVGILTGLAALWVVGWASQAQATPCLVGNKVEVLWKGQWYRATALQVSDRQCYISYDGYDSSWNEWVGPKRLRAAMATYAIGSAVQVLWQNKWYPAHVIDVHGNQYKITYDGYDRSWDEWVDPGRIRRY